MLYPLIPHCETQPLINMYNITLRNIYSKGGLLPPGIIRCNETNPCTGFVFDNVQMDGWYNDYGLGYITENVQGVVINSYPDPGFSMSGEKPSSSWKTQFGNYLLMRIYNFFSDHHKYFKNVVKHF